MAVRGRTAAIGATIAVLGTLVGGAVAAGVSARRATSARCSRRATAASQGIEQQGRRAGAEDDAAGEAAAAAAALRRPDHGRRRQGRGRRRLQPHRPGEDQPLPARSRWSSRGCTSRSCSPTTRSTATGRSSRSRSAPPASFDPSVATADDTIGARESATVGIKQIYSPMVDVSHEPRWGRIAEGAGEDPYLGSVFAAARVKAAQGARLLGARQGRHERQALRRLRPARGRPRLQHDRHVRAAAAATSTCRRSRPRSTPAPTR